MPELRWILLVLGALLIGGLWWWELRRSRQSGPPVIPPVDVDARSGDRYDSRLDGAAGAPTATELPTMRATEERAVPRGDPPVVTLDDLPEDPDQVVLARDPTPTRRTEPPLSRREPAVAADSWPDEDVVPELDGPQGRNADSSVRVFETGDVPPDARPSQPSRSQEVRADGARDARTEGARVEPRIGDVRAAEPRAAAPRTLFGRRAPSIDTTADLARGAQPPVLEPASIASSAPGGVASRPAVGGAAAAQASTSAGTPGGSTLQAASRPPFGAGAGPATPPPSSASPGIEARRPAPRPTTPQRSAPATEPPRQQAPEPPSTHQRIVAIRLAGQGTERFDGAALRAALEAEGMRFGKYSIFHRQRADGRAIYSVASLVEPGSFDLDRMPMQEFPGVSMFAVFPGPVDAPEAFDELLATARRLADRLGGVLQDERGGMLSAQRVLGIREELVSFQNLVTRTRSSRPAG